MSKQKGGSSVDKEREKKRKKEGKPTGGEKKRNRVERERGERGTKRKIFSTFRRSKLKGPRRKVDPHIESYA